jgi:hypothetical protein
MYAAVARTFERSRVTPTYLTLSHRTRRPRGRAANDNHSEAGRARKATLVASTLALLCILAVLTTLIPA